MGINIASVCLLAALGFIPGVVSAMESSASGDALGMRAIVYWNRDGTATVFDVSSSVYEDDDEEEENPQLTGVVIDNSHPDMLRDLAAVRGGGRLPDSVLKFLEENHFWDRSRNRQNDARKNNNNQENQ